MKAYGEYQTSKLSEEQLSDALAVMAQNTPDEALEQGDAA